MSSQPRIESPGSKSRFRPPDPPVPAEEDALVVPSQPTDDTPTIISRQPPLPPTAEPDGSAGLRGRRLAHFELIEPIGVGGMAAVLRARDTQLDRFVALKILPPEMAGDEENVRRFHQEARSAAKLDHENIARVFYCGEDQRLHFIAFEFVEGENLRAILERRGRLPVGEAVHYMLQVAAGLAHAWRRGVVHRDIKPSNIIVTPNGRAKLVDMGLARCLEPRSDNDLTQSGVTLGTFDYISPEQALEPRDADVRSDIYSLGCTFYHMLTGRPPVPEGTAAKKLHHHQHVKPPDPRQFVPDLPVEVVQILDRMMAKQPRDRLGSPEQLVHLLLLAREKVGATTEVPEGVLTMEAALPSPPSSRPLLWVALAAAAVVGLVLLLDQAPSSAPRPKPAPAPRAEVSEPREAEKTSAPPARPAEDKGAERTTDVAAGTAVYESPDEPSVPHLLAWLRDHPGARRIELRLAGVLDIPKEATGGVLVRASQQVIIKAKKSKLPPTIRLTYHGQPTDRAPLVALTVEARECTVEDVQFFVNVRQSPDTEMTALLIQGGSKHVVRRCAFVQAKPAYREEKRLSSLVVAALPGGSKPPEVSLSDCTFLGFDKLAGEGEDTLAGADRGGQDAVVRRGAVRIDAVGCAFGPHSAAFRLEGEGGEEGRLTVKGCSVLLPARRSAAFEVKPEGSAHLDVAESLFSRLPGDLDGEGTVLLRSDAGTDLVVYRGRDNCYHDLDGYWSIGDAWQAAGWNDFRKRLGKDGTDDSRVLLCRPWRQEPDIQVAALDRQSLKECFQVRPNIAALRKLGTSTTEVVGTRTILGESILPATLPPLTERGEQGVRRFLTVDPRGDDSANGIFPSLDQAVRSARPGDTILIRHNGDLRIIPVRLDRKGLGDLTVRPARRFRPVLVLGETTDADAALFRLHDGKLRLEGLEFRLTPERRLIVQTVVALVGDGECTLRGCVVTLQRGGETRLALATVAESGGMMALDMPPARPRDQGPKLTLEGCFVRGEGDLLAMRGSRPFALEVKKTLVAVSGSLLNVETRPLAPSPRDSYRIELTLREVTAYLGGPLVRLVTGKDPRGLVPVACKATSCLFVPAGTGKTLISLEGADTEQLALRDKLTWEGGPNAYGAFKALRAQLPGGDEMPPPPEGPEKWKSQPDESSSTFGVELSQAPPSETRFSQMVPGLFGAPLADVQNAGVALSEVPKPSSGPAPAAER
jgi:serine/threonine protein kinase